MDKFEPMRDYTAARPRQASPKSSFTHSDALGSGKNIEMKLLETRSTSYDSQFHGNYSPPSLDQYVPEQRDSDHSWHKRIGTAGLVVLVTGTVAIFASVVGLVSLWRDAELIKTGAASKMWKGLIFQGRTSQVVTVFSAVIRQTMALHLGVVTSATAAIMLETSGAKLKDAAMLSVQRAVNSTPTNILQIAIKQFSFGRRRSILHCLLIAAAFALLVVSSLISTILLSDFQTTYIVAPEGAQTMAIGMDMDSYAGGSGALYWKSRPSSNWRFAEATVGSPLTEDNVVDTGNTYRALLPFADSDARTSLDRYSGPAYIKNFRTMCAGPSLEDLKLNYSYVGDGLHEGLYLNATTRAGIKSISSAGAASLPQEMECRVHNSWNKTNDKLWPLSICNPPSKNVYEADKLKDPTFGWSMTFDRFFIINSSAPLNGINAWEKGNSKEPSEVIQKLGQLTAKADGPWTRVLSEAGSEVLSITSCYVGNDRPQVFNATMTGRTLSSEPVVDWRRLANPQNNEMTLRQLGVGAKPDDLEARGTLSLDIGAKLAQYINVTNKASSYDATFGFILGQDSGSRGWSMRDDRMNGFLPGSIAWTAHAAHSSVFQAILQETQDPARAVQALAFRLYQMLYYDQQLEFDIETSVATVHSAAAVVPARWTGLFVVVGLVLAHFVLVLGTMALYLARTRASWLGSAWMAVSQMVSPHTSELVEQAVEMRHKGVKNWATKEGVQGHVYVVSRNAARKRVEIQLRDGTMGTNG